MRRIRLAASILLIFSTAAVWALDAAKPVSKNQSPRFEGYRYLDTEGEPLPIQSDDEIEAFLAKAEIVETSLLGTGVTGARQVVLQGHGFRARAIFKHVDTTRQNITRSINGRRHFFLNWRDWHGYEAAAYVLDRLLGTDRVPVAVPRSIDGDAGTIGIWLEDTVNEYESSRELQELPPDERRWLQQRSVLRVFNNLVANQDCNLGNRLIDPNWRVWFIDCTRCFATTTKMIYPLERISHCESGLWEGLKNLDIVAAKSRLSPFLNKAEIKALLARREILVEHFQRLIHERGEAHVLFDVVPPSETAPRGGGLTREVLARHPAKE